jgi:hypothetical protein
MARGVTIVTNSDKTERHLAGVVGLEVKNNAKPKTDKDMKQKTNFSPLLS